MTVISVRAKNFKKLKNLDINPNGKTFAIVGDSEKGKTSLMQIIQASLMQIDFPTNALTTGEQDGFLEVVHELDGIKYTVSRPFNKKGKTRFTVKDENGGRHTLETLLEKIFGRAFVNANFDYYQFFFQNKSAESRFQYLVKAAGGDEVINNIETITKKKRERGVLGTQRTTFATLIEDSPIHPDNLENDLLYYAEPKNTSEAAKEKEAILQTRDSVFNVTTQLEIVKDANEQFKKSQEHLLNLHAHIIALEKELTEKRNALKKTTDWQKANQPDFSYQTELEEKLSKVEENNLELEKQADIVFNDKLTEINTFNKMRDVFNYALINFEKYNEVDEQWTEIDMEIRRLAQCNKEIFMAKIPIPGLTIEDIDDKNIILYEGRELCFENISKGRSIRLAIEIQRAINPKGSHIVMIPEAQSLGSQLDEILAECKEYGIQAIIELTERKQEFHIEFEDEFLDDKIVDITKNPIKKPIKKQSKEPKLPKK